MDSLFVSNPFIVGKYLSDRYFCDRTDETAFLKKQIANGRNVVLTSPRRIGKSGLIHHLFHQPDVQARYHVFFIDIYATTSLSELVYLLGKSIYEQLKPLSTRWKERFFQTIASLRLGAKLDATTGLPTLDLGLGDITVPLTTLDEIFSYLNEADKPCIIAIDEFQQIAEYGEKNVEALLRTHIQQCATTQFIFAGSRRHVMSQIFNSPTKPFYQSAIGMSLNPLPMETYADFAVRLFGEGGKQVEAEVARQVWQHYEGTTWFIQMVMNELYALTPPGGTCTADMVPTAIGNVVLQQDGSYRGLLSGIAPKQKAVLQAIAREGTVGSITSSAFVKKYGLSSASSVQSAMRPLLKSDLVVHEEGVYRLADYFLRQWLAEVY